MSERVKQAAMVKLHERVNRLVRLMNAEAPVALLSAECELLGDLAAPLDPKGYARRTEESRTAVAKQALGVCIEPTCEADAPEGERLCPKHEDDFVAAYAAARASS